MWDQWFPLLLKHNVQSWLVPVCVLAMCLHWKQKTLQIWIYLVNISYITELGPVHNAINHFRNRFETVRCNAAWVSPKVSSVHYTAHLCRFPVEVMMLWAVSAWTSPYFVYLVRANRDTHACMYRWWITQSYHWWSLLQWSKGGSNKICSNVPIKENTDVNKTLLKIMFYNGGHALPTWSHSQLIKYSPSNISFARAGLHGQVSNNKYTASR